MYIDYISGYSDEMAAKTELERLMKLLLPHRKEAENSPQKRTERAGTGVDTLLASWEIYPILLVAAFLRFFNIDKVIFGQDEADIFRLAHDAFAYGFVPLTSSPASLGNLNPPLMVYFFMLPASLSANPLWGEGMIATFNTAAVLLTYFFTRRYYGRLAGTIAALLFATSVAAWQYSRNIWPQNFLPFFVMLFIWMLFRGVVDRKKGWFVPAIVLLGVLYQLHESTLLLVIPLLAAILLAFRTIRLRDIGFAILALFFLFAPFLVWETHVQFVDIKVMLSSTQSHTSINLEALRFYLFFIHPTLASPYLDPVARIRDNHLLLPNAQSLLLSPPLRSLHLFLQGSFGLELLLLFGGIFIAAALVLFSQSPSPTAEASEVSQGNRILHWWTTFLASPDRQGLLLLLCWQVAPLLLLTRHSIVLFTHYFIFLLPGEFILMAIVVVKALAFLRRQKPEWEMLLRSGALTLVALVILAQLIGSGSALIDLTTGNFSNTSVYPHFNDLHSAQNALQEADQLAQQRGIHRIYITESRTTDSAMDYLSAQLKTPVELIDDRNCLTLPDLSAGPVVFLAQPDDQLDYGQLVNNQVLASMFSQYAHATLVATPPDLGGDPYRLYILTAQPSPAPLPHTFAEGLQLLAPQAYVLPSTQLLVTRWRIPITQKSASRTNYHYLFHFQSGGASLSIDCKPTATWAGDQLFTFQPLQGQAPAQTTVQVSTLTSHPTLVHIGPLTVTTFDDENTPIQLLRTADQKSSLILPVAAGS